MRYLLDTNVLISAALFPTGTPGQAYDLALTTPHNIVVCDYSVAEMRRVFQAKFPTHQDTLERFLGAMQPGIAVVETPEHVDSVDVDSGAVPTNTSASSSKLVDLSGQFLNLTSGLKALVKARSQMLKGQLRRSEEPKITDSRGRIRQNWAKSETPLSPEKVTELVDQYIIGTPVKVLAEQFGIPRQTVLRHAQRAGVAHQPKPFSDNDVAEMVAMYESGLRLERISAQVLASPMRVRRILVGQGVLMRPPGDRHLTTIS